MIYAKKVNGKQRAWLKKYEAETGFEPLYQEDIDSKEKTFAGVADLNCQWFEDWASDTYLSITANIPS